MSSCLFCDIIHGEKEASIVYQDDQVAAFMDIRPVNIGHVLVAPNIHASSLAELPLETGAELFRTAQRVAAAIRTSGIQCEGINFFLADGQAAGQEVFHVHLHVFPRFKNDGLQLRFAVHKPDRSELDASAEKIRKRL